MSSSKSTRPRGDPDYEGPPRVSTEPTDALPGSEEKVQVMQARVRRFLSCFNNDDARLEDADGW